MKRRSEQMYPIIESYLNGHKSKQELCDENALSIHVFQYWLGKYNRSDKSGLPKADFMPIQVEQSRSSGFIRIRLNNGTEIEVPMA